MTAENDGDRTTKGAPEEKMAGEEDRDAPAEAPPRGVATMAFVRWALVLATAVVAAMSILSYAGVLGQTTHGAAQLYQCPMHPSIVQDQPGQCPICGMTLVAKPQASAKPGPSGSQIAGGNASDNRPASPGVAGLADVEVSAERIQLIGMRTAQARREPVGGELRTVGIVVPNERGLAQINTRFAGWVQKLAVSQTGEHVKRGQVLATIYSPEVLRAQQELLVAHGWNSAGPADGKSTRDHATFTAELDANARRRLELLGISAQEIDEVLRTGKIADAIAIRSPVEGYVVAKTAVVGVAVQPGAVLFEVADLSRVWVTADVYEQDVSRVRIGQRARFEPTSYPGEPETGKVQFIYPVLDSANRTLRVRLELANRVDRNGPRLRPGMYGTVHLDLPATTAVTVPAEAVVDTGEAQYLFVSKPGGRFVPRPVKVGRRVGDRVEIRSGVTEGETVVTTGNFLVDSESRLRAAIAGQTSSEAAQASGCSADIDGGRYPDKLQACRACEIQHRGMGTMEEDCKKLIAKPWR